MRALDPRIVPFLALSLWTIASAAAQDTTTQPATTATTQSAPQTSQPTTQPADRKGIFARVIEVHGDAKFSPVDADDWKPLKKDDELPEGTKVRTGVKSWAKFQIGNEPPFTAMIVEGISSAVLSEAAIAGDTKRVRVGVGYGKIRAGVAEGGLKSDFTVDSPVATLSKRGTWDFGLFFERGTDRFEVFLLQQGLVDALNKATQEHREVLPGAAVTEAMRRWFDEAQVRDRISMSDLLGQSGDLHLSFNHLDEGGIRVIDPQGGHRVLLDLSTHANQTRFADLLQQQNAAVTNQAVQDIINSLPTRARRVEGFFGTGRGDELIPIVFDANSQASRLVSPGVSKLVFRRSALESFVARSARPK